MPKPDDEEIRDAVKSVTNTIMVDMYGYDDQLMKAVKILFLNKEVETERANVIRRYIQGRVEKKYDEHSGGEEV